MLETVSCRKSNFLLGKACKASSTSSSSWTRSACRAELAPDMAAQGGAVLG
jgi:hypothetical protein